MFFFDNYAIQKYLWNKCIVIFVFAFRFIRIINLRNYPILFLLQFLLNVH